MEYIIQIFQKGGPLMYPLLFLGVLAVAFYNRKAVFFILQKNISY